MGQQIPPLHWPPSQSLPVLHVPPDGFLHAPPAHVPRQLSGSGPSMLAHLPGCVAVAQLWQVPQLDFSQHTPSTQNPVKQSVGWVQVMATGAYSQVSSRCPVAASGSTGRELPPNFTLTPRTGSNAIAA